MREKYLKLNEKMLKEHFKRRSLTGEHKRKIGLANSIILRGRKLPEEVKRKISEKLTGRKLTEAHKKHLSEALKGKPKSEKHKRKLSEALKGKPQPWNAGEKCHFWRGGMMKKVLIKCTICGRKNPIRKGRLEKLNHPYRCLSCSLKGRVMSFETKRKLSLAHRKYNLDELFFEKIDNEEKAYWLGFLAGDGNISDENRLRIRLAISDKKHLLKFKQAVKWSGKDYSPKHQDGLEVHFKSFKMITDLTNYCIVPRKTYTIKFPNLPKSLERHFIRGVFDADGCISRAKRVTQGKSGQIYIFYSGEFNIEGNKEFVAAIQSRLAELGLPRNSINYPGKTINRVRYGGINQLRKIYKYLYENSTIYLERKKKMFEDILKNYHYEVIKQGVKEIRIPNVAEIR